MSTAVCRKCQGPIIFRRNSNGKWEPREVDGSEHWTVCNARVAKATPAKEKPPLYTEPGPDIAHLWSNDALPPWDESLGAFRNFSAEEVAEGIVCRLIDRPSV